jgi:hypothetical protein
VYWQVTGILGQILLYLQGLKIEEVSEKFKIHQQFFFIVGSFQPYQIYPNSKWCDSPFNENNCLIFSIVSAESHPTPTSRSSAWPSSPGGLWFRFLKIFLKIFENFFSSQPRQ